MADEQQDVRNRLDKLEAGMGQLEKKQRQSVFQFFVQYLLSPLLLVVLGAVINWRVENTKANIERVDVAQKMLPNMFEGKPEQAFATERLMAMVIDPEVAKELHMIVFNYYDNQVKSEMKAGNVEEAAKTLAAARAVGGAAADQVVKSIEADRDATNKLTNYQMASSEERKGFESLVAGKYDDARQHFDKAEKSYNGYHNAYEIARLLQRTRAELENPEARKQVLRTIVSKYSYKAPPDLLEQLKTQARG